ncbi:MAG: hypothetical protein ACQERN_05010 [Thermodesulfobacteriota bacterium]
MNPTAKTKRTHHGYQGRQNVPEVMYKRHGKNMVDVTSLIRSIQKKEGNTDCFRRPERFACQRKDCAWRLYCMKD